MSPYIFGFIICVLVAKIQEIVQALSPLYVGKLAVISAIMLSISSGRLREVLDLKETKLLIAFWGLAALMIPFSFWPGGSFNYWEKSLTTLVIFYVVISCYSLDWDNCITFVRSIAIAGFLLCIEIFFVCTHSASGALVGTQSYDRNDLALTLVYILPFVLALFQMGKRLEKIWAVILGAIMAAAIFRTNSRGGVIGLFFVIVASMFAHGAKAKTKLLIFGLCLGSLFLMSANLYTRFDAVWTGTDYNYSVGRIPLWKDGARLFLSHIVTGVGAGQGCTAMGKTYGNSHWRAIHNIFLQVGIEFGLPGLLLFMAILYAIWKNTRRGLSAPLDKHSPVRLLLINSRISLLGFLVCGVFLSDAISPIVPFLLAFTQGLAVTASKTLGEAKSLQKTFGLTEVGQPKITYCNHSHLV